MRQQLVPTVDGKRVALREFLVFDEEVRDKLLEVNYNEVTSLTRKLLRERGQPMRVDADRRFEEGLITERLYNVLLAVRTRRSGYTDLNSLFYAIIYL